MVETDVYSELGVLVKQSLDKVADVIQEAVCPPGFDGSAPEPTEEPMLEEVFEKTFDESILNENFVCGLLRG